MERLPELRHLSDELQTPALDAWSTAWRTSSHADLDRIPYSLAVPEYSLLRHVQEVTQCGLLLSEFAEKRWGSAIDRNVLLSVLILHDVDKPLLYEATGSGFELSAGPGSIPHGVLGAMLLKELGFPEPTVEIVATHAVYSPFHSNRVEAWVLHYADFYATDHVMRTHGQRPFYQGH